MTQVLLNPGFKSSVIPPSICVRHIGGIANNLILGLEYKLSFRVDLKN